MSSRKLIVRLVPVVVVGLALSGYFLLHSASNKKKDEGGVIPDSPGAAQPVLENGKLVEVQTPEGALLGIEPDTPREEGSRVDMIEQEAAQLEARKEDERQWISGKVVFAFSVPKDEELYVLSLDGIHDAGRLYGSTQIAEGAWNEEARFSNLYHSTRVAADGSFRVHLPAHKKVAHLALTGRYIYSMRSTALTLPVDEGSVRMTGKLGGWITGELQAPTGSDGLSLEGIEVQLGPDITANFDAMTIGTDSYSVRKETAADGAFEFRAVPSQMSHAIIAHPESLAGLLLLGVDVEPGEHLVIEERLQQGATIRGRVEGPGGEAIVDAELKVSLVGQIGAVAKEMGEARSDENGAFVLENVFTGMSIQINAHSEGMRGGRLKLEEKLRDGQELDGLVVVLEDGNRISGRVTYPDGTPAVGAEVDVSIDLTGGNPQMIGLRLAMAGDHEVETAADGSFHVEGLDEGPFEITATINNAAGEHPGNWSMRRTGVKPEEGPQILELQGLCEMTAQLLPESVISWSGNSIEEIGEFRVVMSLEGSGGVMGIGAKRLSKRFKAPEEDNTFIMEDVLPGVWEVTVAAEEFAVSESQLITVPQLPDDGIPVFELTPAAAVAGVVVDTFNKPIPGARVSVDADLGARLSGVLQGKEHNAVTDYEGRFLLEGLSPGSVSLVARMTGFAGNEPSNAELVSGQITDGLVLMLRVGGVLTGEVMDDEGEPAAGKMVVVQVIPGYNRQQILTTDSTGSFRVENLEPGQWQVVSMPSPMTGDLDVGAGDDLGKMLGELKMDTVEIKEGEATHVILGEPPEDPIEVFGVVVHDGSPISQSIVSFIPEGAESMGDMKVVSVQEDGSFRVTLAKRGPYLISLQQGVATGRENRMEFRELIPAEVANHNLTLELPGGSISGKVIGPDGRPKANCRVSLSVDEGIVFGTLLGGHYTEVATGKDGDYEVLFLAPGKYRVSAGGSTLGGLLGDDSVGGRIVQSGIVVSEGQSVSKVDFRLERPGELTGLVLSSDQRPVKGATVFLRDSQGRVIDRVSFVTTDSAGNFKYSGLAEGKYTASARLGELVSSHSESLSLKAGGAADCQLTIDDGTTLVVSVIDKTGKEVNARLSVRDSRGYEMAGLQSMQELMSIFTGSFSTMEQRVGPLPVGRYKVSAVLDDGRSTSKNITVSGRSTRKVKLRVK